MCMVRHCMLSERVASMHTRKCCVCASLVQNAVCTCCASCRSVKKGLCKVTGEKIDIRELKPRMATLTRKLKYEVVCWSLSHSNLAVRCAGVSAFRFPIVGILGLLAITTTHCTVHHHAHTQALAWHGLIWCASAGTCNVSLSCEWDGHGQ